MLFTAVDQILVPHFCLWVLWRTVLGVMPGVVGCCSRYFSGSGRVRLEPLSPMQAILEFVDGPSITMKAKPRAEVTTLACHPPLSEWLIRLDGFSRFSDEENL